jgi:hypothetical protein
MVFFSFVASLDVKPQEIINRTAHEWNKASGTRLLLKELQDVDSEMVVSLFKVSTLTGKEVILAELRTILKNALQMARLKHSASEFYSKYEFCMIPKPMVIYRRCLSVYNRQSIRRLTVAPSIHSSTMLRWLIAVGISRRPQGTR